MLTKYDLKKLATDPRTIVYLRIAILITTLAVAFFAGTGMVSADPGWGVVGG